MTTIDRLRDLEQAATPGPWQCGTRFMETNVVRPKGQFDQVGIAGSRFDLPKALFTGQVSNITRQQWEADANLIAESRNALPALLAVAEAARLVSQWADAVDQMPDELRAELRDLAALARLEATE